MSGRVEVSIIIPSFNGMDTLPGALNAIEDLDYPKNNFQVIVVDDGSTDGTREFVSQFIDKSGNSMIYVYQDNAGPAAARNTGIQHAQGEYLLIIDSDSYMERDILNRYLSHFPQARLGGVGGDVIPDSINTITKYLDCLGVWRPGTSPDNEVMYLVTANAFFLRQAIMDAGCFDGNFRFPGGEEPELCHRMRKIGYHFQYDREARVLHSHQNSFRAMTRMFFNHGKGAAVFLKKWPESGSKMSIWKVALGIDSFKWIRTEAPGNAGFTMVIKFLALDYSRKWAAYFGYRSVIRDRSRVS